ncbi:MAG: helix-hairpin-helix domain-containing protein [Gemmatimonadetes bacterium]|nr:helix-hairpin-helix domain-containing protein [Gemmatimonadota bacterium]
MPTAAERQALLFLLGVTLLGGGVRLRALSSGAPAAPDAAAAGSPAALRRQRAAVDSAQQARRSPSREREAGGGAGRDGAEGARRRGAPQPVTPIPVNDVGVDELERLPRVGPALARRIVADREARGPFPSLEALERVPGIGPATLKVLAPFVTFSPSPRPSPVGGRGPGPRPSW